MDVFFYESFEEERAIIAKLRAPGIAYDCGHETIQESVRRGIQKINLATEIKNIFMKTLKEKLEHESEIDLRKVFPDATNAIIRLVAEKLQIGNLL